MERLKHDHELLYQMARAALSLTPAQAVIDLSELAVTAGKRVWGWYSELNEETRAESLRRASLASADEVQQAVLEASEELRQEGHVVADETTSMVSTWLQGAPRHVHQQTLSAIGFDDQKGTRTLSFFMREEDLQRLYPKRMPVMHEGAAVPQTQFVCEKLLGIGSFGEVWRAQHRDLPDVYAFKICTTEEASESVRAEKDVLVGLTRKLGRHKNIVTLHDYRLETNPPWLKFELVEGRGTLNDWIMRFQGGVPENETLRIVRAISAGLAHAHRSGVVHADIKPANILMTEQGNPKITDFGVGRILAMDDTEKPPERDTGSSSSRGGGTYLYMSPEQRHGKEATAADDIYALGVLWYQMLVGDPRAQAAGNVAGELRARKISKATEDILMKCLETSRDRRFANGKELHTRLTSGDRKQRLVKWGFRGLVGAICLSLMVLVGTQGVKSLLGVIDSDSADESTEQRWLVVEPFSYGQNAEEELPAGSLEYLLKRALILRYPSLAIVDRESYDHFSDPSAEDEESASPTFTLGGKLARANPHLPGLTLHASLGTTEDGEPDDTPEMLDVKFTVTSLFSAPTESPVQGAATDMGIGPLLDWIGSVTGAGSTTDFDPGSIAMTSEMEAFKYFIEGERLWRELNSTEARKKLAKACSLDKRFVQAYLRWAEALAFDSEIDKATEKIREAIALFGGLEEAREGLAKVMTFEEQMRFETLVARHVLHSFADEINCLKRLATTLSYRPEAQYELAEAYFHTGDCEQAIGFYRKATELNPHFFPAYNHEAYCHAYRREFSEAMKSMESYLETTGSTAQGNALDSQGDLLYLQGDYPTALEKKKEATYPNNPDTACCPSRELSLAKVLVRMGRDGEAEDKSKKHTNHPMALFMRAWLAYLQKDDKQAKELLEQMMALLPKEEDGLEAPDDLVTVPWGTKTYKARRYLFLSERWILPLWLRGLLCHREGDDKCLMELRAFMYGEIRRTFSLDGDSFYRPVTKYHRHLRTLGKELAGEFKKSSGVLEDELDLLEESEDKLGYWTSMFERAFFLTEYATIAHRNRLDTRARQLVKRALDYNPNYVPALLLRQELEGDCTAEGLAGVQRLLDDWQADKADKKGHLWRALDAAKKARDARCAQ